MNSLLTSKQHMIETVWEKKEDYYVKTHEGNEALLAGPHYQLILPYLRKARRILEVGCGDGGALKTLATVLPKQTSLYGVDISSLAISFAQKKFPAGKFSVADGNTLPYEDAFFDSTCSFFTFEHVIDPKEILLEMERVTKPGGTLCIICPNYGSPIYPSPCASESIPMRLIRSFFHRSRKSTNGYFGWKHVTPIADTTANHVPDHDTLIEPDLSLFLLALSNGQMPTLEVLKASSLWQTIRLDTSVLFFIASLPFRITGWILGYPFAYWGPLFVVVLRKKI